MFILIDLERLAPLYKNVDQSALMAVANIELPYGAVLAMSATDEDSYKRFTDYELKVLFKNICGVPHDGFHRSDLITSVRRLVGMLPETEINLAEAEQQLASIKDPDDGPYLYHRGGSLPLKQPELFLPTPMTTVAGLQHDGRKYFVRKDENKIQRFVECVKPNPYIKEPKPAAPRDPNAPREVADRPKAGSTTERVWAIADSCFAKHSLLDKTLRNMVAQECEAQGINPSTMSVQFSKWKHHKNNS